MSFNRLVAAPVIAATSLFMLQSAANAETIPIVTGGTATVEFTVPFNDLGLGINLSENANGNPERSFDIRSTSLDSRNYPTGGGSQVIDGGASLSLRGSLRLEPLDAAGNTIESFADVKIFNFRDSSIPEDLRTINFVPTADPNVFTNLLDPSQSFTLTDELVAQLQDAQFRTCCIHTLGGFEINTVTGTFDGVIDGVAERDINFDGVIDAADEFFLFDLAATGADGVFDLILTDVLAQFLNIGFLPGSFLDGSAFAANWARFVNGDGPLNFQGGETVGTLTLDFQTGTVEAVPLPATLPLLAGAIGLMGAVGARRRKRTPA